MKPRGKEPDETVHSFAQRRLGPEVTLLRGDLKPLPFCCCVSNSDLTPGTLVSFKEVLYLLLESPKLSVGNKRLPFLPILLLQWEHFQPKL